MRSSAPKRAIPYEGNLPSLSEIDQSRSRLQTPPPATPQAPVAARSRLILPIWMSFKALAKGLAVALPIHANKQNNWVKLMKWADGWLLSLSGDGRPYLEVPRREVFALIRRPNVVTWKQEWEDKLAKFPFDREKLGNELEDAHSERSPGKVARAYPDPAKLVRHAVATIKELRETDDDQYRAERDVFDVLNSIVNTFDEYLAS
jgi:hypothetical protein